MRLYDSAPWEVSEHDMEYLQVLAQNLGITMMYFRLANALLAVKDNVDTIHSVWLRPTF